MNERFYLSDEEVLVYVRLCNCHWGEFFEARKLNGFRKSEKDLKFDEYCFYFGWYDKLLAVGIEGYTSEIVGRVVRDLGFGLQVLKSGKRKYSMTPNWNGWQK